MASLLALVLIGCDQSTPITTPPAEPGPPAAVAEPTPPPPAEPEPIKLVAPYTKEAGFSWTIPPTIDPDGRKLKVFEDGKELGPAGSLHDDVRKVGRGAYSHWKAADGTIAVYFSTSDNTDPNAKGRTYELR